LENLIQLNRGNKSFLAKKLFLDASFSVNEREHVGVIGPNGAGKTTLFKVLIGEEELDSGDLIRSRKLRLGYLSQHDSWNPDETVEAFLSKPELLPIWELKALGHGLGLSETVFGTRVASLSGGYRMRVKLLRLLGEQPNLMLLDEPTNYLDLETLLVLEKFLQSYNGAFLLISHDREFLRRTTDHILEIELGEMTKFNGNIDDYFTQKQELRAQLEARAMSLEEKRKQVLDFVARFGASATKASQAQSRLKSLDRMETIEIKPLPVTAKIRIPEPARTGQTVLRMTDVELGYPEKTVLSQVHFHLQRGERVGVVGLNGAGKSTLLKSLGGRLTPQKGAIELGHHVTLAFFNQFVAEELNPNGTVLTELQAKAHPQVSLQDIRDLAGALLFSGNDLEKPVRILSGGERSRVALGQVLLQKASCLILDEPTNHLDFQTVEALTQALERFAGSVLLVSHDRGFIRRVSNKILEIQNGKALSYPGTYDEYVWSLEKGAYSTLTHEGKGGSAKASLSEKSAGEPVEESAGEAYERRKQNDRRKRQLEKQIAQINADIARNHENLAKLNGELVELQGSPDFAAPVTAKAIQTCVNSMSEIQRELNRLEENWFSNQAELEQIAGN